jgi:sporulation-control protein spo0M
VQEQAFFSSLMNCTIFAHQRVDFGYVEPKPVLAGVVTKLENLGLKPFLQHRCDWNGTIIRQLYATYEMDFHAKNIKWMTKKSEYEATFAEFAAANYLDYEFF